MSGGPGALAFYQQGNLYAEGAKAESNFPVTAGAYVSPVRSTDCSTVYYADPRATSL
jgi:hypothetical protein